MSVLETAIGWLAPPTCIVCGYEGLALCEACITTLIPYGQRCYLCGGLQAGSQTCIKCRRLGGPSFVWITSHYESQAKDLIKLYKFNHLRCAAISIAQAMANTLNGSTADYLVVPVPTATSRIRARSFDHTWLLAKSVASRLKLEAYPALARIGQSKQLGMTRQLRLTQPEGSYRIRKPVAGYKILLIDDVITTGATIREAARILKAAGAVQVDALVFAKRLSS